MASSSKPDDNSSDALSEGMQLLPPEILLMIFDQLPPNILSELQRSGIQKIRDACMLSKIADFRSCPTISEEATLNYISMRRHHLTELYADDMVCVSPTRLSKAVSSCKQLRVLSLRHVGISLSNVIKIIEKCSNVVDFSWSTGTGACTCFNHSGLPRKWTKLTLDIHNIAEFECFIRIFSMQMRSLIQLELNFYILRIQLNLRWLYHTLSMENVPDLQSFKVACPSFSLGHENPRNQTSDKDYPLPELQFTKLCGINKNHWKTFWFPFFNYKEYISFVSESSTVAFAGKDSNHISESCSQYEVHKSNSFEAFGISCKIFDVAQTDFITNHGGSHLKSLVFRNSINSPCTIKDFSLFVSMLISCKNITHFDGRGIHQECKKANMLCDALCYLKFLKKLCFSVCSIRKPVHPATYKPFKKQRTTNGAREIDVPCSFDKMISSCPLVEEFILSGCELQGFSTCPKDFSDQSLSDLYKWKCLRNLRLEVVKSIRLCSFLVNVGKYCKSMESLQLISIGCPSVFHFMPNLCTFIKSSQSVKFIKIVHKSFNFNSKPFWDALPQASALEALCFTTKFSMSISSSIIANSIEKMRQLQSFHLRCHPEPAQALRSKLKALGKQKVVPDVILENSTNRDCDYIDEPACLRFRCCRDMVA